MPNNTTTLYIDDTNIRLMVTRGKRITKLADVPLETNLDEIGTAEKEAQLVAKIKYLFKSNKINAKKIILGLSGLRCLTRPIVLPELPKAMLDEAVTREARRVLPVPVEQLYISWQMVSTSPGKIQAFMVAIPRPIADTLLKILNQAGFKPYLMDIKPLALARLAKEPDAILVDVQASEFDVIIMSNGLPQPIRSVSFPQESLSLKERLLIVKDEVKRTVQFFNSNSPDKKIQANATMLVSGEIADEQEIYESLGQEMGFKAVPLTSPLKCLKQLDPSRHLVNVGLALKELARGSSPLLPNFNTLPAPYQPKQISMNRLAAIPATAAAIGLVVLLGMTVQNAAGDLDSVKVELDSTNLLLEKRQAQKDELAKNITTVNQEIAASETERESLTKALNGIDEMGNLINSDLRAIVSNVVPDLEVINIGHAGRGVSLSGEADSEQEVLEYVRKLTATGRFEELTISSLARVTDDSGEHFAYSLNLSLKDNEQ